MAKRSDSTLTGSARVASKAAGVTARAADAASRMVPGAYFRDRTVLIAGASSGIGRDIALTFARMGAKVALLARRRSMLDELAEAIRKEGAEALPLAADVTHRSELKEAVARTLTHFARIDVLVNSAGVALPGPVEIMPPEDVERMMSVNLMGTLHAMQLVLPAMRARGAGNIVNIASLAGRRGMPPLGGYCATKFAVVGLTEALRVELFGSGVKVSLVMPGVIDTPMARDASGAGILKNLPESIPLMPPQWVTWAVIAAVVLGLAEIDVPPGAVVMEKLAAFFPGLTDAAFALGNRVLDWLSTRG